jgi:hypothetical protein
MDISPEDNFWKPHHCELNRKNFCAPDVGTLTETLPPFVTTGGATSDHPFSVAMFGFSCSR